MHTTSTIDESRPWLGIPAWLFSLAIHLTVVILGVLLIRPAPPAKGLDEKDRPAAIVLVQRTAAGEPKYFSDDPAVSGRREPPDRPSLLERAALSASSRWPLGQSRIPQFAGSMLSRQRFARGNSCGVRLTSRRPAITTSRRSTCSTAPRPKSRENIFAA